jgi:hypothetical protein
MGINGPRRKASQSSEQSGTKDTQRHRAISGSSLFDSLLFGGLLGCGWTKRGPGSRLLRGKSVARPAGTQSQSPIPASALLITTVLVTRCLVACSVFVLCFARLAVVIVVVNHHPHSLTDSLLSSCAAGLMMVTFACTGSVCSALSWIDN